MKNLKNILKLFLTSIFSFALIWYTWNHTWAQIPNTPIDKNQVVKFKGTILAASDADQIGTAYADGVINKVKGIEDSLTILNWNEEGKIQRKQLHISNSVVSWPSIIAHSPDKKFAYIVETRGIYTGKSQKLKNVWTDLPSGKIVSVVDISPNNQAQKVQEKVIGINPKTASVNQKGDLLLIATQEKDKEIALATLKDGLIDQIFLFAIAGLSRQGSNGGINAAEFHPNLDVFAVIKDNRAVEFYRVIRKAESLQIEAIGQTIPAGKVVSVGNFTPDGRFFIVADVGWGDTSMGNIFNSEGYLVAIQFDEKGNHQLINKAKVGLSPEGFDISPDGEWAIAVNMRRTYLPKGLPYALFAARKLSSLSLVKIDKTTGKLATIGNEYGFEGELPEDAIFDADSKTIAVTIYNQRFEEFPRQGYIEFWNLSDEKLIRTDLRVPLTRGCHNLKLVK
ncbi:MAG: hypothetical protein MUE85_22775 [Microscillaceae bacterium]|jgi:DNA-binding beta-propeller fold protein YncE|nr:hypothetical protein [Microscillaceae bacterium]